MHTNPNRKYFVAGNWKMQGSKTQALELIQSLNAEWVANAKNSSSTEFPEIAVCPSYPYLNTVKELLDNTACSIQLGAQDLSAHSAGAYTGQVSGAMLKEMGCQYVLVGHSECRQAGDTNELVADKFFAAKQAGLTPILCVGETLEERQKNQTELVVNQQLNAVLLKEGIQALQNSIIAYEPVWAIGTGKTASPEEAQQLHGFLRKLIIDQDATLGNALKILYGGSVKASNAASLFAMPDIDGALVGGASLDAKEFFNICRLAC